MQHNMSCGVVVATYWEYPRQRTMQPPMSFCSWFVKKEGPLEGYRLNSWFTQIYNDETNQAYSSGSIRKAMFNGYIKLQEIAIRTRKINARRLLWKRRCHSFACLRRIERGCCIFGQFHRHQRQVQSYVGLISLTFLIFILQILGPRELPLD